jgi:hypothetical protein
MSTLDWCLVALLLLISVLLIYILLLRKERSYLLIKVEKVSDELRRSRELPELPPLVIEDPDEETAKLLRERSDILLKVHSFSPELLYYVVDVTTQPDVKNRLVEVVAALVVMQRRFLNLMYTKDSDKPTESDVRTYMKWLRDANQRLISITREGAWEDGSLPCFVKLYLVSLYHRLHREIPKEIPFITAGTEWELLGKDWV